MIKGPGESPSFREFFFTENKTSAAGIAHTFGLDYFKAENEIELEAGLRHCIRKIKKAALLEIFTDAELNAKVQGIV
jgi:2-succinyl-5-enolpyruvyl-6-hydroxy-3-cyclohexene-1-carboxylate synthase